MSTLSNARAMRNQETMSREPTDRRIETRFRVQFRTVVSIPGTAVEGSGTVLDLSFRGCRINAPLTVQPSTVMELRLYAPNLEWPLMIDGAVVQWVDGSTFGLRFLRLRETEKDRLAGIIETMKLFKEGD